MQLSPSRGLLARRYVLSEFLRKCRHEVGPNALYLYGSIEWVFIVGKKTRAQEISKPLRHGMGNLVFYAAARTSLKNEVDPLLNAP